MKNQYLTTALLAVALVYASPAAAQSTAPSAPSGKAGEIVPLVDYHAHISSLMYAQTSFPPILPAVPLPPEISQLMSNLEKNWNSASGLAPLFTEDTMTIKLDMHNWVRGGRDAAAALWSSIYVNGFKIIPVSYTEKGPIAYLRGYLANPKEPIKNGDPNYFGVVFFVLEKENDGQWRVANKIIRTAPVRLQKAVTAEQFLGELDAAGIQRANNLSIAFVFAGPPELQPNEAAKVREENDWNAQQAARYPARLTAFCSFNPLKPYALAETESCGRDKRIKGLKFHFSDSRINLKNPEHLQKVQAVFKLANKHRLAITAHIRYSNPDYDSKATSTILLNQLLPLVPEVPVQIAHMTGDSGFDAETQAGYDILAAAIEAKDPRTRKLYFDGTVSRTQSDETSRIIAAAMRRVGLDRILFGSDRHAPQNLPPAEAWKAWLDKLPFTEAEFRNIADNLVQYRQ